MDLLRFFFMNSLGAHNAYNAKFCLCTSGGGARAMTHTMGVYRALHEMGILEEVDGMSPSILRWRCLVGWRGKNVVGFLRLLVVTTQCLRMVTMIHLNNYCLYDLYVFLNGGISNSKVTMIYATQTTLVDMWNALSKSREFYVPYLLYVHVFFLCHVRKWVCFPINWGLVINPFSWGDKYNLYRHFRLGLDDHKHP